MHSKRKSIYKVLAIVSSRRRWSTSGHEEVHGASGSQIGCQFSNLTAIPGEHLLSLLQRQQNYKNKEEILAKTMAVSIYVNEEWLSRISLCYAGSKKT
ncbi:hypothetical protein AVEN_199507-1 [Araneus ventricosus]|uniref:Uncharacterized protein n=1 Tax=Araneus ventricosus TaxID=182803 RepID=A0A4Y2WX98_ARAVE|nr:hypothetical protein AVEN_199507-1 [Araneus ventricosus]